MVFCTNCCTKCKPHKSQEPNYLKICNRNIQLILRIRATKKTRLAHHSRDQAPTLIDMPIKASSRCLAELPVYKCRKVAQSKKRTEVRRVTCLMEMNMHASIYKHTHKVHLTQRTSRSRLPRISSFFQFQWNLLVRANEVGRYLFQEIRSSNRKERPAAFSIV